MKMNKMVAVLVIAIFVGSCIVGSVSAESIELEIDGSSITLHGSGNHYVHVDVPDDFEYDRFIFIGRSEPGMHSLASVGASGQLSHLKGTATTGPYSPKTNENLYVQPGERVSLSIGGHSATSVTTVYVISGGTMLTPKSTPAPTSNNIKTTEVHIQNNDDDVLEIEPPEDTAQTTGTAKIQIINEHHQVVDAILYIDGKYKDVVDVPPDAWEFHHGDYELSEGTHTFRISWIDLDNYEPREHELSGYIRARKMAPITLTVEKSKDLPAVAAVPVTENIILEEIVIEQIIPEEATREPFVKIQSPVSMIVPCKETYQSDICFECTGSYYKDIPVRCHYSVEDPSIATIDGLGKDQCFGFVMGCPGESHWPLEIRGRKEGTTKMIITATDQYKCVSSEEIEIRVTPKLTEEELAIRQRGWDEQAAENKEELTIKLSPVQQFMDILSGIADFIMGR